MSLLIVFIVTEEKCSKVLMLLQYINDKAAMVFNLYTVMSSDGSCSHTPFQILSR